MLRSRVLAPTVMAAVLVLLAPAPGGAQLMDLLTAPKTLIDRAIEARSAADIVEDNKIVLKVNGIMADLGTIKASTEIYEQRLLVTGIFDDRKLYDKFHAEVKKVPGIKRLHWHVRYMSKAEQEKNKKNMIDWADALVIDTKAGVNLIGTRGVADVNYREAVDAFGTLYVLGRARSQEEMNKVLKTLRATEGVKRVVNYAYVKP